MTDWTPKQSDIDWVRELLRMLKDGATWVVPCSTSIYTFYHSRKEYVLVGDRDDETNQRTNKILDMFGWKERKSANSTEE